MRHWRTLGARSPFEAKSVLITRARQQLGVEAVRGHAILKLDRLRQVSGRWDAVAASPSVLPVSQHV